MTMLAVAPKAVRLAAITVSLDEPALWLFETVRPVYEEGKGTVPHRFLHIGVRRGDAEAEYVEDLGAAANFPGECFYIPGGAKNSKGYIESVEKVGTLLMIAEEQRMKRPFLERKGIEFPNLIDRYRQQAEEAWRWSQGQSTFGPHYRKQRDL